MKHYLPLLFLSLLSSIVLAQGVEPAPADKAVVYFVRASGLGAAINFHYYDGDQLIGKFNGSKYLRYECDPGKHLFWGRSENRSFVEAELAAGNIYLIDVRPQMGGLKAAVSLQPISPLGGELPRPIRRLVTKRPAQQFSPEVLTAWAERTARKTANGMERYEQLKQEGAAIAQLTADMMVAPEDFKWEKKRKN